MTISSALRHLIPERELETALSPADVQRLTLFRWEYTLEHNYGFTGSAARHLSFLRWLRERGRLGGWV